MVPFSKFDHDLFGFAIYASVKSIFEGEITQTMSSTKTGMKIK
jgi:hypothetical protein